MAAALGAAEDEDEQEEALLKVAGLPGVSLLEAMRTDLIEPLPAPLFWNDWQRWCRLDGLRPAYPADPEARRIMNNAEPALWKATMEACFGLDWRSQIPADPAAVAAPPSPPPAPRLAAGESPLALEDKDPGSVQSGVPSEGSWRDVTPGALSAALLLPFDPKTEDLPTYERRVARARASLVARSLPFDEDAAQKSLLTAQFVARAWKIAPGMDTATALQAELGRALDAPRLLRPPSASRT